MQKEEMSEKDKEIQRLRTALDRTGHQLLIISGMSFGREVAKIALDAYRKIEDDLKES